VRTLVILNPAAGAGRTGRRRASLEPLIRRAVSGADIEPTTGAGHATDLARRAVADGYEFLVAVGGDGTIHEVVNGMLPSDVPLAIVPTGTGNDFVRSAGLPRTVATALAALARGAPRRVDVGHVLGHYYVNVAGAGFDAEVAAEINRTGRKAGGAAAYLRSVVSGLLRFRNLPLGVEVDGGRRVDGPCMLVAVGNGAAYAGGLRICPRARVDDGQLDVCTIGDVSRAAAFGILPLAFLGAHLRNPRVRYGQGRTVAVDGPPEAAVHADGEIVGRLPARFEVVPGALLIWGPEAAAGPRSTAS
jgi:diacylglycerol kinase (ATP)